MTPELLLPCGGGVLQERPFNLAKGETAAFWLTFNTAGPLLHRDRQGLLHVNHVPCDLKRGPQTNPSASPLHELVGQRAHRDLLAFPFFLCHLPGRLVGAPAADTPTF